MSFLRLRPWFAAAVAACPLALAACTGSNTSAAPEAAAAASATIRPEEVVGRWGYAAFHEAKDRSRTEANARGQCNHPFLINEGPTGGVMMYPPDQSQMHLCGIVLLKQIDERRHIRRL